MVGEAASYGVPSVAFDVSGGARSLVLDRETGLLAPPADVTAFAAALAGLMASTEERRRLGTAARAHVEAFRPDRSWTGGRPCSIRSPVEAWHRRSDHPSRREAPFEQVTR